MNRRGFLSCAGALALAGCASRPLPPRATPAVASIEPAGLEALYAITPGRDGVVIRTASGGCTRKEDFVFYVERRGLTPTLAFARRRLDNCRSFAAAHADLAFAWSELGLPPNGEFVLLNPLTVQPGP
ncbi:MAG: hypothetical protein BGN86_15020 [Caulobacterales bacterium 68-7]|nr:MAG: hypothetical protein BGN86_15020 [Caulobacterales bacterium 68-7]